MTFQTPMTESLISSVSTSSESDAGVSGGESSMVSSSASEMFK